MPSVKTPAAPPSPPAPPVKRPVKIGGKVYPPGQLKTKTLPNGKILVSKDGKPDEIVAKLKGKDGGKWTQGKVTTVLAALESTQEPAGDALGRDGLKLIEPDVL